RLVAHDLSSGAERDLYEAPLGTQQLGEGRTQITISNDGRLLAFSMIRDSAAMASAYQQEMVVVPTTGGPARTVVTAKTYPYLLGLSADARYVMYTTIDASTKSDALWRAPVDGGQPERLVGPAKLFRQPAFSPDGRRLAYSAGEVSEELWVLE